MNIDFKVKNRISRLLHSKQITLITSLVDCIRMESSIQYNLGTVVSVGQGMPCAYLYLGSRGKRTGHKEQMNWKPTMCSRGSGIRFFCLCEFLSLMPVLNPETYEVWHPCLFGVLFDVLFKGHQDLCVLQGSKIEQNHKMKYETFL